MTASTDVHPAVAFGPTGRVVLPPELRHIGALLQRQSRERPDKLFLTIEGRSYTFAQAHELAMRTAAGLASGGVGADARVGVMLPNVAAFVWLWFALSYLGATIVAINPQFRGRLLDTALGDTGCSGLVVHAASHDALASVSPAVRERIKLVVSADAVHDAAHGDAPGTLNNANGVLSLAGLQATDSPLPPPCGDQRSIHTISFTSGSTGPSKGVLITTNQALDSACTYIHATALGSGDTLYTPFAFFHGMSTRLAVLPALIVGAHVVVVAKFSASRYWQDCIDCSATVAQTLAPMTAMLKALPPGPQDTAHRVTRMYNSRADEAFERRFGVHLVEAYGMTEIGLPIYCPYPERRAGAAGLLHPEWEMAIVDDDDRPVPAGEPGELVFRPRSPWLITPGYVGRPDATVEATRNLWFHTGDIGRQDADGYVYFIDRRKERIRRMGENISSFDVESIVSSHADVRECAALAHPAALGEDDVRIIVVAAAGRALDAGALYDWLTGAMPKYMLPRFIEFATELPRTATNKIEKLRLKEAGLAPGVWDRDVQRPGKRKAALA